MKGEKWIEFIRLRSSTYTIEEALPELQKRLREIEESSDFTETLCMQHALYDGDLAVAIIWSGDVSPRKSVEGLLLADRLQELGSIDHSVWTPTPAKA